MSDSTTKEATAKADKNNDGYENDDLLALDYGFRIYNPAIGRFLSVDPLTRKYPMLTPYQFAGNSQIKFIDIDGLERGFKPIGFEEAESVLNNLNAQAIHQVCGTGNLILSFSKFTTNALKNDSHYNENYNWDFVTAESMIEAEQYVNAYKAIYGDLDNIVIADHGSGPVISNDPDDFSPNLGNASIQIGEVSVKGGNIRDFNNGKTGAGFDEYESLMVISTSIKDNGTMVGMYCLSCRENDDLYLAKQLSEGLAIYRDYNSKGGINLLLNGDNSVTSHGKGSMFLDAPLTTSGSYSLGFIKFSISSDLGNHLESTIQQHSTLRLNSKGKPIERSQPGKFNKKTRQIDYDLDFETKSHDDLGGG